MAVIREKFNRLRRQGRAAFIPYLTFGFPDIRTFESIVLTLDKSGADFIEIGFPFSDPIADGPIIQASSAMALDKGADIYKMFRSLKKIKKKISSPLILMTYYNPVYAMGLEKFFRLSRGLIDGIVVPDLLVEESADLVKAARHSRIDTVFFISPTTQAQRVSLIKKRSSGFIYYISVAGVTGPRKKISPEVIRQAKKLKAKLGSPLCIGFGVSTRQQARAFKKAFDGVIVGSALISYIFKIYKRKDFLKTLRKFVLWLNG